jgi:flagellar biosynthesis/type III secretory pathway protein FliH
MLQKRREPLSEFFKVPYREGLEQGRQEGFEQGREQGLEQGREQGREQGLEQGRQGWAESVIEILRERGFELDADVERRIRDGSPAELRTWSRRVVSIEALHDLFE